MALSHVLFVPGASDPAAHAGALRTTLFTVDSFVSVAGASPDIAPGMPMWRLESAVALEGTGFRGVAQHLNYTSREQKADLDTHSQAEFPAGAGAISVVIPIKKAEAWWQLPPEERAAHFQRRSSAGHEHDRHTKIGLPFAARIFRKLYHSRYAGGHATGHPYDFVTYFEFLPEDAGLFRELLAALRDTKQNPEWAFVETEFEIWLRRE